MKYILIILTVTIFSFSSNPFKSLNNTSTIDEKDSKKFQFIYKSALNGDVNAQFDLAMMYGTGTYTEKNSKKAFNWLHKSAFNGHIQAQYLVGISFKQGTDIIISHTGLARYWFRKASKAGHKKAKIQLARLER